jgi:hypothetical protein
MLLRERPGLDGELGGRPRFAAMQRITFPPPIRNSDSGLPVVARTREREAMPLESNSASKAWRSAERELGEVGVLIPPA